MVFNTKHRRKIISFMLAIFLASSIAAVAAPPPEEYPSGMIKRQYVDPNDIYEYYDEEDQDPDPGWDVGRLILSYEEVTGFYKTWDWGDTPLPGAQPAQVTVVEYEGVYAPVADSPAWQDVPEATWNADHQADRRFSYVYDHNNDWNVDTGTNIWVMREKTIYDTDGTTVLEYYTYYPVSGRMHTKTIADGTVYEYSDEDWNGNDYGRLIKETRPDGTYKTFEDYYDCTASGVDGWFEANSATYEDELVIVRTGSHSVKVNAAITSSDLRYEFADYADYAGETVTFSCWVHSSVADSALIEVRDGATVSKSTRHSGSGGWELLTVTHTVDALPSYLRLRLIPDANDGNDFAYFDDGMFEKNTEPGVNYLFNDSFEYWYAPGTNQPRYVKEYAADDTLLDTYEYYSDGTLYEGGSGPAEAIYTWYVPSGRMHTKELLIDDIDPAGTIYEYSDEDWNGNNYGRLIKQTRPDGTYKTFEDYYDCTSSGVDGWFEANAGTYQDELIIVRNGSHSVRVNAALTSSDIRQEIADYADYAGETVTFSCWVHSSQANSALIEVRDGVTVSKSTRHTGSGDWELLTVTHVVDGAPSYLRLRLIPDANDGNDFAYFDDGIFEKNTDPGVNYLFNEGFEYWYAPGTNQPRYVKEYAADDTLLDTYEYYSDGTLYEGGSGPGDAIYTWYVPSGRMHTKELLIDDVDPAGTIYEYSDEDWNGNNYGRLIKQTRPDGTYKTFGDYYDCTASGVDGWFEANLGTYQDELVIVRSGSHSVRVNAALTSSDIRQEIANYDAYAGKTVTFSCWVHSSQANSALIEVRDGVTVSKSTRHTGSGGWELLTVTHVVDGAPSYLRLRLIPDANDGNDFAYFDDVMLVEGVLLGDEGSWNLVFNEGFEHWFTPGVNQARYITEYAADDSFLEEYEYYSDGILYSETFADGTVYTYYDSGRMHTKTMPDGTVYGYTDENWAGHPEDYGRLIKETRPDGTYKTFEDYFPGTDQPRYIKEYDAMGDLLVTYEYDIDGNLISQTNGTDYTYYVPSGRIHTATLEDGTIYEYTDEDWNGNDYGRLIKETRPDDTYKTFGDYYDCTSSGVDGWFEANAGTYQDELVIVRTGSHSVKVDAALTSSDIRQEIANYADYAGETLTFSCWVHSSVANSALIEVRDGVTVSKSTRHSGSGDWELLTVTHTVGAVPSYLRLRLIPDANDGNDFAYFDDAMLVWGLLPGDIGSRNLLFNEGFEHWYAPGVDQARYITEYAADDSFLEEYEYYSDGTLYSKILADGTVYTYYDSGRMHTKTMPDGTVYGYTDENWAGHPEDYGRLIKETRPDGTYKTFEDHYPGTDQARYEKEYDEFGNLLVTYIYDVAGHLIGKIDSTAEYTYYVPTGRMHTKKLLIDDTDPAGTIYEYSDDPVHDIGLPGEYGYLIKQTDPDGSYKTFSDYWSADQPRYVREYPPYDKGINLPWTSYGYNIGVSTRGNPGYHDDGWSTVSGRNALDAMFSKNQGALVRVFLFCDMRSGVNFTGTTPTTFTNFVYEDMQALIDKANEYGIKLMPVLLDFTMADGNAGTYEGEHPTCITNGTDRSELIRLMGEFVEYFQDNDAIYAWDIMNEPEMIIDHTPGIDAFDMQTFVTEMADRIHEKDPGKLVTLGAQDRNSLLAYWTDAALTAALGGGFDPLTEALDLYQFHYYNKMESEAKPLDFPASDLGLDKPVIIGEVDPTTCEAFGDDNNNGQWDPGEWYYDYNTNGFWDASGVHLSIDEKLASIYENGYSGALFWQDDSVLYTMGDPDYQDIDNYVPDPPLREYEYIADGTLIKFTDYVNGETR